MTKTDWPGPMPVVEVAWLDSATGAGWRRQQERADDFDTRAIECRSVGYLWKKTRQEVALMQSVNEEGQLCAVIVIPRFAVTRMTVLRPRGTSWETKEKNDGRETFTRHASRQAAEQQQAASHEAAEGQVGGTGSIL